MANTASTARAGAALFTGAAAWAAHELVSYAILPVSCRNQMVIVPFLTLGALIIIACGAWISYGALAATAPDPAHPRLQRFVAEIALLAAALFAFAILLQGIAALILDGCQQ